MSDSKRSIESSRVAAVKAVGFGLMLIVAAQPLLGWAIGFTWFGPILVFVVVPVLDALIGEDKTNIGATRENRWQTWFKWVPRLYILIWFAVLLWVGFVGPMSGLPSTVGLLVSLGVASGFATCACHELLHRGTKTDYAYARVAMSTVCYGHFVVEHLHHHATVGRYSQGTVPAKCESLWSFLLRNVLFGFRNSYHVAERMRSRKQLGWMRNRALEQHALSIALFLAFATAFGNWGITLFVVQAVIAICTVEFVQLCEHYALVRTDEDAATASHSWNSNGWLTNALTLNITRHSDHHLNGRISYEALRMVPGAPTMPMGYFGLFWLALIPAIWRRAIDPIVDDVERRTAT